MQIKGCKVVITGGTGGIGKRLSDLMRNEGAEVLVVSREGGEGVIQSDLADESALSSLAKRLSEEKIDILINLAGLMYFGHFVNQAPDNISKLLRVNLEAPIKLAQAVIPHMLKNQKGKIVNIGSVFGAICFPHFVTYSTAKSGLKGFSEALRREYAGKGISVAHISPRAVATPLNAGIISKLHTKTKTVQDSPEKVATFILKAIKNDQKNATIGFPESFFVRLNAVLPGVVDNALVSQRDIAEHLLNTRENKEE